MKREDARALAVQWLDKYVGTPWQPANQTAGGQREALADLLMDVTHSEGERWEPSSRSLYPVGREGE